MDTKNLYKIDRKAASRLLGVSVRTLDRYLKGKKLSTQVIGGRIWLNRGEIEEFKVNKNVDRADMSTSDMSIDIGGVKGMDDVDNPVDTVEVIGQKISTVSTKTRPKKQVSSVYKKLHNELKEEIQEKQERLEIANYRVGQLETQVKNSIPMLEYHRETFEKDEKEKELKRDYSDAVKTVKKLSTELKYEKFNRRFFLILILIILALQPLWLILAYK